VSDLFSISFSDKPGASLYLPEEVLNRLSTLSSYLASTESVLGSTGLTKTYIEIRSKYVLKSLAVPCSVANPQERKGLAYAKGEHPFLVYASCLQKMLEVETEIAERLVPRDSLRLALDSTLRPSLDEFKNTADGIIQRAKRNSGKHDFNDVFVLFDLLEGLNKKLPEFEHVMSVLGKERGNDVADVVASFTSTASKSFSEFLEDIKVG
jgi:hypothetical protein